MLKNQKLLGLLTSPDDPDGEPLRLEKDFLVHSHWQVPVVDGIPDFVTHAPPVTKSFTLNIPIDDKPPREVLQDPQRQKTPEWFQIDGRHYTLLKEHEKGFLLDVGCGQGKRSTFQELGYDYIGLDISFNSQQRCDGPADVDIVADCHRIPLPSCSVEVVSCEAVLEHLYFPLLAVQEIRRILKPGGLFVGSCSFLEGEHHDSQYHHSFLGLYRLLRLCEMEVRHIYAGISLWELYSGLIFFSLPGHRFMGRLLRALYPFLMGLKSKESPRLRLLRHAAVLHFVANKPR
jgi:SAM-dependent methyltransferase